MYEQQFLQKRNTFSHPQFMCFDYCWGPQYHLSIIVPKQPSIRRSADLPIHPSIIDHKENEKHQRVMDNGTKTLTFERLKPAHWNTKHRDAD